MTGWEQDFFNELLPAGSDINARQDWLKARREGITASEIATIMGLSRYDSPRALYYRKRGEISEDEDSDVMRIGRHLEKYVLVRFEEAHRTTLFRAGLLASRERPWQRATPDALWDWEPVEAKTTNSWQDWGPSGSAIIPVYYRTQVLWQMDVLSAETGWVAAMNRTSGEFRWYKIPWDPADAGLMRDAAEWFMSHVALGIPPEVDSSPATVRALRERFTPEGSEASCGAELVDAYRTALELREAASEAVRAVENEIRDLMGTATRLRGPHGEEVAYRVVYSRPSYVVKATTVDSIRKGRGIQHERAEQGTGRVPEVTPADQEESAG